MRQMQHRHWRTHHHLAAVLSAGGIVLGCWWWVGASSEGTRTLAATSAASLGGQNENVPAEMTPSEFAPVSPQATHVDHADQLIPESAAAHGPDDEELRRQLAGSWADDFYGKRTFDFEEDGTATMALELDSVGKLLYGPKLTFFIVWDLKGGVLSLKMTGGEPAGTAVSLAKLFGESSEQRIERIDDTEMHLRSLDSNKLYVHRRLPREVEPR